MWSIYAHCKLQTSGKNCETTISAAYMGHHHALGILGALDIGEIHQIITKDLKPTLSNYHFQPKILRRAMILKGNMEADETGWGTPFWQSLYWSFLWFQIGFVVFFKLQTLLPDSVDAKACSMGRSC